MPTDIRRSILSNVSYVFGAQMLIMIIGIVRSLILPAFFSVSSYGYWEIYLFYTSYVGLFSIGYNDGVYLRYGEYDYSNLPFKILRPANIFYFIQLFIFSSSAILVLNICISDPNTSYAMSFAAMNVVVMGIYGVLIQVLQITNQFKKYSFFSIIDKALVLIAVGLMFIGNQSNFRLVIIVDFLSKVLVVAIMVYKTRELWFGTINTPFRIAFQEYRQNISVGIKLMIANLMSMLMVGAGRLIVQVFGDIEDFGVYSFGVTVTNLVIIAISAFSLVLYPILKRLSSDNYASYFKKINTFTRSFSVLSLLTYFPACLLILSFYIKYGDVLIYLNFLFGVVFLQAKISILNNTFFNVLRKEGTMLKINMTCLGIFILLALSLFYFFPEIKTIAFCTFFVMFMRCYFSEIYLLRRFESKMDLRLMFEILYLFAFIVFTSIFDIYVSFGIIFSLCMLYFILDRRNILATFRIIIGKK